MHDTLNLFTLALLIFDFVSLKTEYFCEKILLRWINHELKLISLDFDSLQMLNESFWSWILHLVEVVRITIQYWFGLFIHFFHLIWMTISKSTELGHNYSNIDSIIPVSELNKTVFIQMQWETTYWRYDH